MSQPTNRCELMFSLPKGGVGAEIGVLRALFSERLLELTDPSVLWLVDAWAHLPAVAGSMPDEVHLNRLRIAAARMRYHIACGKVRLLCGTSEDCVVHVPKESLDWVYIDADPSYRGCMADLKRWSTRVKRGGIIAVRDYQSRGVRKAVSEFCTWPLLGKTQERRTTGWFRRPA